MYLSDRQHSHTNEKVVLVTAEEVDQSEVDDRNLYQFRDMLCHHEDFSNGYLGNMNLRSTQLRAKYEHNHLMWLSGTPSQPSADLSPLSLKTLKPASSNRSYLN